MADESLSESSLATSYSSSCLFGPFEDDNKTSKPADTTKATQPDIRIERVRAVAELQAKSRKPEVDDHDFSPERYLLWHKKATLHRARVGPGRSHEMSRLYNFWLAFLPDRYNDAMYQAFKRFAEEDASAGHTFGLTCLFHFFLRYLSQDFEPEVYKDFESLALKYQDYINYDEGMECLCQFLVGASSSSASQLAKRSHRLSSADPASSAEIHSADAPHVSAGTSPSPAGNSGLLSSLSSSSSSNLLTSGMLLVAPGQSLDSGIEVDTRALQQLQAWQAMKAAKGSQYHVDDAHGVHAGSVTGSSEAGGEVDVAPVAALPPKRLGRRPNGKLAQALRRASARCSSPPATVLQGTSPPPPMLHMAGSAPSVTGRFMPGASRAGPLVNSLGAGNAAGWQGKRSRHPKGSGRRGVQQQPPPLPPSDLNIGTTTSLHMGAAGYGSHGVPGPWPCSSSARGLARSQSHSVPSKAHVVRPTVHVTPGSRAIQAELDMWEAKPCAVTCGAATAEIVKVLPLRLGELFGD